MNKKKPDPARGIPAETAETLPREAGRREHNAVRDHNIKKEALGPNTRR